MPVIRSTVASAEAITNELVPLKEGITTLNMQLKTPESEAESELETEQQDEN